MMSNRFCRCRRIILYVYF